MEDKTGTQAALGVLQTTLKIRNLILNGLQALCMLCTAGIKVIGRDSDRCTHRGSDILHACYFEARRWGPLVAADKGV